MTPKLIFDGIIKISEEDLRLTCGKDLSENQINQAIKNSHDTWKIVLDTLPSDIQEKEITVDELGNPESQIVILILRTYAKESPVYPTLN